MSVQIRNLRYNPAAEAFEGRIDIQRGNTSFRYPCTVEGPVSMSPAEVRQKMKAQARSMSDTPPDVFSRF
ncbi:orotidine 5'-phosphate decarboxylase [Yoonia sp. R2331]|uniref:orotidine 5'-phosphate decarboxylase n=1 Tax=Yoonia sp. R2331 TaxID=3237238 RepID=UPI0034E3ED98